MHVATAARQQEVANKTCYTSCALMLHVERTSQIALFGSYLGAILPSLNYHVAIWLKCMRDLWYTHAMGHM